MSESPRSWDILPRPKRLSGLCQTTMHKEIANCFFVTTDNVKCIDMVWYVTFPKVNQTYRVDDALIQRIRNDIN